jgi:periplasmic protein TonB
MSDLGTLSHCMMDSDPEAARRARRLRRKALVASIVFETLLVLAMLIWPLITPGVLRPQYILTPLPPFPGEPSANPMHPHASPPTAHNRHLIPKATVLYQPQRVPPQVDNSASDEPPSVEEAPGNGNPEGPGGTGPAIFGSVGEGDHLPVIAPPPARKPRTVSIGVMEASLINRVDPAYPAIARATHISGEVRLRATIGTDGKVKDYEVLSGNPLLAQAAIAAVRQWRYRPTQLNGEPVEVETLITVNFILR